MKSEVLKDCENCFCWVCLPNNIQLTGLLKCLGGKWYTIVGSNRFFTAFEVLMIRKLGDKND